MPGACVGTLACGGAWHWTLAQADPVPEEERPKPARANGFQKVMPSVRRLVMVPHAFYSLIPGLTCEYIPAPAHPLPHLRGAGGKPGTLRKKRPNRGRAGGGAGRGVGDSGGRGAAPSQQDDGGVRAAGRRGGRGRQGSVGGRGHGGGEDSDGEPLVLTQIHHE